MEELGGGGEGLGVAWFFSFDRSFDAFVRCICSMRSFDAFVRCVRSMRPVPERVVRRLYATKIRNTLVLKVKQHNFFYFTYRVRNYIKIRLLCPTSPEVKKRLSLEGVSDKKTTNGEGCKGIFLFSPNLAKTVVTAVLSAFFSLRR